MKADDLLDLIGDAPDSLIQAAEKRKKNHSQRWTRWAAMAACLCLVAAGAIAGAARRNAAVREDRPEQDSTAAVGWMQNQTEPVQPDSGSKPVNAQTPAKPPYGLSASEVGAMFASEAQNKEGRESNQYTTVFARSLDELCAGLPESSDTINLYTMRGEEPDAEEAKAFFDRQLPFLRRLSSVSDTDYSWTETRDAYGNPLIYCTLAQEYVPEEGEDEDAWSFGFINLTAGRNQYTVTASRNTPLMVADRYAGFPVTASDEEIKTALGDVIGYMNESFGTDYSDIRISRAYRSDGLESVSVYLYDAEASVYDGLFGKRPLSDGCISLVFYTDWGEGTAHDWSRFTSDQALLGDVSFYTAEAPWDTVYTVLGTNERLSLEEAEEMLAKGYVFGGHSCPLCMEEQEKLDFSAYDGVALEYVQSADAMIYVPFYAFYKSMGENEYGMPAYARTYVCASRVSGLEEYFDRQTEFH